MALAFAIKMAYFNFCKSLRGTVGVDLETLTMLHRQHLLAIPYENLDIHLGRTLTLDLAQIFDKIVHDRRGGWCYEMNGLIHAARRRTAGGYS